MKVIGIIFLSLMSNICLSAEFPITENVEITMLEVWPSNSTINYSARVKEPLVSAGCPYLTGFQIQDGPGAEAAYSTLLAGVAAKMKIQIYITECGYMAIADRIRLIPN